MIFLGYSHLSLTGRFGIMESSLNLRKILDPALERPPTSWIDVVNIIAKPVTAIDVMEHKRKKACLIISNKSKYVKRTIYSLSRVILNFFSELQ